MAWGIGLKRWTKGPFSEPMQPTQRMFQRLSLKLLLSYVGAMTVVMGFSAGAVYQYFAAGLLQEVDAHLVAIAEAAKHNYSTIAHNPATTLHKLPAVIDQDADLDLPWQISTQSLYSNLSTNPAGQDSLLDAADCRQKSAASRLRQGEYGNPGSG
jgi:hypothetical protein